MDFRDTVKAHAQSYPLMRAQDYVKLAYQHALGCGHLVSDRKTALQRIHEERDGAQSLFAESIGNGLSRLHFVPGAAVLSDETILNLFVATANAFHPEKEALRAPLSILRELAQAGELTVSAGEMNAYLDAYTQSGLPLVSHTEAYRAAYRPRYRVVSDAFANILQLIEALETLKRERPGAIVAIDGMCASGKSTLASRLSEALSANVFHMDDFFLPLEKRTPERLSEIGGNVDYERFLSELLLPLISGKPFAYRPFDCSAMSLSAPVNARRAALNIVEGAYACHQTLIAHYDFIVLMEIDPALQKERIRDRNGEDMLRRFESEWIPMENRYLAHERLSEKADLILRVS